MSCNGAWPRRVPDRQRHRSPTKKAVETREPTANIPAMDAVNPSATPTFASRTPLHIGAVGLIARDLDRLTNYYRDLLGLTVIERNDKLARLGAGGTTLIEIEHRPNAKPDDPAQAGLYHTAFLMPTRQDHARWIMH